MYVFSKVMFFYTKKPPAGLHHTEVRIGDAPKPPFPMHINSKKQKLRISDFGGRRQRRQPVNAPRQGSALPLTACQASHNVEPNVMENKDDA